MVIIRSISKLSPFSYLWLKTVNGVDLEQHCAKCLLGEYDSRINNELEEAYDIALAASPCYYLCGVSKPYAWKNNFHLAFKEKEGSVLQVERNGIKIEIENAEELHFGFEDIPSKAPHSEKVAYRTCRNWQFAHYINARI